MTKSAQSVYYFGIYLLLTGLNLLAAPNLLLDLFGLPQTPEVWIRVVGMVVIFLGVYYVQAGRHNLTAFFQTTVFTRITVPLFFGFFILKGWVGAPLILFGIADFLGAIWTWLSLRSEGRM